MTPHRHFRDDDEQLWAAWDVVPAWGERRVTERRVSSEPFPSFTGERRKRERRQRRGVRISLPKRLARGWLAFESDFARRRAAPIPNDWHLLTDEELKAVWRSAEQLPPRRRRLVE